MRYFLESNVVWMDSIDSTNEEIKRKADKFIKTTWVLAKSQTQGKGRNGKIWLNSQGNFAGSVIFFPTVKQEYYHLFGFFFGVALYNTIKKFLKEDIDVRLKWPNDLIIENRKVAGILLETIQIKNDLRIGLIVGIGVNLNSSPNLKTKPRTVYNAGCISSFTSNTIDQVSFFKDFNNELISLESYIDENNLGFILDFWQKKSYEKGSIVQFSDQRGKMSKGKFLGLDELGSLIIDDISGVKKLYSGDVYFGS